MSTRPKSWSTRRVYEFIKAHRKQYDALMMCRALDVTRSGYYRGFTTRSANEPERMRASCV
jgi:hypothetical protein